MKKLRTIKNYEIKENKKNLERIQALRQNSSFVEKANEKKKSKKK